MKRRLFDALVISIALPLANYAMPRLCPNMFGPESEHYCDPIARIVPSVDGSGSSIEFSTMSFEQYERMWSDDGFVRAVLHLAQHPSDENIIAMLQAAEADDDPRN